MMKAISAVLVAGAIAGCGSASPPASFYTLDATSPAAPGTVAAAAYSIVVGPVTVPDMADRPQMVLRTKPNQVEIAELARWAEPLRDAIPRVVAVGMQKRLTN